MGKIFDHCIALTHVQYAMRNAMLRKSLESRDLRGVTSGVVCVVLLPPPAVFLGSKIQCGKVVPSIAVFNLSHVTSDILDRKHLYST